MSQCKKILIVDANQELLTVMRELVYSIVDEVEIYLAASADEAIDCLRTTKKIDVLLTEIILPTNDGIYLMKLAQQEGLMPEHAIFFSSSTKDWKKLLPEDLRKKIIYFEKPGRLDELVEYLAKLFD